VEIDWENSDKPEFEHLTFTVNTYGVGSTTISEEVAPGTKLAVL